MRRTHLARSALASLALLAAGAHAESVNLMTAPLVTPSAAATFYGTSVTHTAGAAAWNTRPPELKELATALGAGRYSADTYASTVYEYIRNNIAVEFRFGLAKGARGAVIDQSGTPFDQAHLMVELLRQGGLTASYQVGSISLTSAQFQAWTGLGDPTTGLVNAAQACQFLANGGIPATVNGSSTCTGLSGTLSTSGTPIVMWHVWVSANSKIYDPAYKIHVVKTGVDLSVAMGCNSGGAVTCGSTVAGMIPPVGTLVAGVPYIQGTPATQTNIESQLNTYATNLETYIKSANVTNNSTLNPNMQVEDLVGGKVIDLMQLIPTASPISSLPASAYPSSPQYSWTGDIPDQFRTTFTVMIDNLNSGSGQLLYADETYGSRLRIWGTATNGTNTTATRNLSLYLEYRPLATSSLAGATGAFSPLTVAVHHAYAANSGTYASENLSYNVKIQANECEFLSGGSCSSSNWYIGVVTVLQGWGDATDSTLSHFTALQQRDVTNVTPENPADSKHIWMNRIYVAGPPLSVDLCIAATTPSGPVSDPGCFEQHQGAVGAQWLAQATRVMKLTGGINGTAVQHHHSLGAIVSGRSLGVTVMNLESAVSGSSKDANAADLAAAYASISTSIARLEGSVLEQSFDTAEGGAAASMIVRANWLSTKLVQITPSNVSTAIGQLVNYPTATITSIQNLANSQNSLIVPQNGTTGPFCLSGGSSCITYLFSGFAAYGTAGTAISFVAAGTDKGTGGVGTTDPANAVLTTTKLVDYSTKGRKRYGVDLASGGLQLNSVPDLVSGTGEFPFSLPVTRSYSPEDMAWFDQSVQWRTFGDQDAMFHNLLIRGTGWTHNFGIYAKFGSDGLAGMGRNSALDASSVIAALYVQRALNLGAANFQSNLATIFTSHWLGESLFDNVVSVKRPPRASVFVKMPDGTFNPEPGTGERLVQTGSRVPKAYLPPGGQSAFDSSGVSFLLTDKAGSALNLTFHAISGSYENIFTPATWSFPVGVVLTFSYDSSGSLTGVANTLGRSLSFVTQNGSWVSEGTGGRSVKVSITASTPANQSSNEADGNFPASVSFTEPDGGVNRYVYVQNPLTATGINRQYSHISQWFTPSGGNAYLTIGYDSLYRVNSTIDNASPQNQTTNFFISGLYGSENQKRGELMEPLDTFSSNPLTTKYFDKFGKEVQSIDALGHITSSVYDTHRRLAKHVYPELNTETYTYDVRHNVLTKTVNGKPSSGAPGLVTTTTYPEGPAVSSCTNVNTCNQPATIDGPRTDVVDTTTYSYNSNGTLARVIGPAVAGGNAQTDLCYTTSSGVSLLTGKVMKVNSSTNRVWSYAYNPVASYLTLQSATVDPATTIIPPVSAGGACTSTSKSGALALTTAFTYDTIGNVLSMDGPRTDVTDLTNYSWDPMRHLTRVSGPQSTVTHYCYDADGELTSTNRARIAGAVDNNGVTVGLCSASFDPAQWQSETRAYKPTGDLASVTDAQGNLTAYDYDAEGRLRVTTDPDGRQAATVYDRAGQSVCTWRGGGSWTAATAPKFSDATGACDPWNPGSYTGSGPFRYSQTVYTPNGKEYAVQDGNNNTTTYTYDGLDRLQSTLFPDASHEDLSYSNGNGPVCSSSSQPCQKTTRKGDAIVFTYDAADELTTKAPANLPTVTYAYNLAAEKMSVSNPALGNYPTHTTTYDYDGAGRKKFETNDGRTVNYGWDQAGNRQQTSWPDSYYISYNYDELNRMTYAYENGTAQLAAYGWDPLSRRQSLQMNASTADTVAYAYEPDSDLQTLTHTLNTVTLTLGLTHNGSHQIKTFTSSDSFYLPAPSASPSLTYVLNNLNEYTSVGGNAQTYDLNGNLLTWAAPDGEHTYTYDAENRLRMAAVAGSIVPTITYDYDSLGRRVSKTVNGVTTSYLLDGDEEVAEYSGTTLLRRYITGPVVDDRIAHAEGSATTNPAKTYYHVDHHGSVVAMVDGTGTVTQRMSYDEYGNLSDASVSTGEQFRYTGRRFDPETGLYYYRARYYSPVLGRFLQTDSIGYKDDLNLYSYVGNDPLNKTDATGQCIEDLCIGEAIAVIGFVSEALEGTGLVEGAVEAAGAARTAATAATAAKGAESAVEAVRTERGATAAAESGSKAAAPYKRPSGATTPAQRASVQGKPCVKCGATTDKQVAGHKEALVKEYHETGAIDKQRMRSPDAVQSECPTCSAREGAEMSRYSRKMNETIQPPPPPPQEVMP